VAAASAHEVPLPHASVWCPPDIEDDCDFVTEFPGTKISCRMEHNSRKMYTKWIGSHAHVLEVGARYGQTTCALSNRTSEHGLLVSVEADPAVWSALEANLAAKNCKTRLIKGVVGPAGKEVKRKGGLGYGTLASMQMHVPTPHVTLDSLGTVFDTLAIDCEGCFATFLEENPALMQTLKLIIVESHNPSEKAKVVQLEKSGWTLMETVSRQRVLCNPPCEAQCIVSR